MHIKKIIRLGALLLCLAGCTTVNSPNQFGTGYDDSNTANPIDSLNPTSGTYGSAAYPGQLYNFLAKEDANRWLEQGFGNFVVSGCLGITSAGLIMTPSSCIAYNAGFRSTETGAITFPNTSTCWVAMDENTTGNNAGMVNFSRASGTHYLFDCIDGTQPTMPTDAQLLMKVTTSGGAITAVTDLRIFIPNFVNLGTLHSNLNANGFRITGLGANTTFGDALSQGNSHLNDLATATGNYSLGANSLLYGGSSSGVVTTKAQATAGTWTFQWPNGPGTSGFVLQTDGTGLSSWASAPPGPPSGAAGGDLGGTYPNPTVGKLHDNVRNLVFGNCPVTVGATDSYISIDATAGVCTVNLPASAGAGSRISIEKTDSTANAITITRAGADTIDGNTTVVLGAQYEVAELLDAVVGTWHRATLPFASGDVTGPLTATTVAKVNGSTPGGTCTNQFVTALSSSAIPTCTTPTLASAQFANQGTTTTVAHGNAAGNPSWSAVNLTTDVTGTLPIGNGGTGTTAGAVVTVTIQKFTASGTYTPHAGILYAIVECVGGGGAGGSTVGAANHVNSGSGGGAGGYSRVRLTAAQIGGSQTVTIGAGGLAGASGTNPGGNGGDTSLGTLCVGKGGSGGPGGSDLNQSAGGAGGVAGTGDVTAVGNYGQQSEANNSITLVYPFPMGGAGPWGGQSNANNITGAGCFTSGTAGGFGTGGAGGLCYNTASNGAGAAGAPGIVIVTEFNSQ